MQNQLAALKEHDPYQSAGTVGTQLTSQGAGHEDGLSTPACHPHMFTNCVLRQPGCSSAMDLLAHSLGMALTSP